MNNRGFGILEVLIASALLGFLALVVVSMDQLSKKVNARTTNLTTIEIVRTNLLELLKNPDAWQKTVDNNSTLKTCLEGLPKNPPTNVCPVKTGNTTPYTQPPEFDYRSDLDPTGQNPAQTSFGESFRLHIYRPDGNSYYDGTNSNEGFTFTGERCQGYKPQDTGNSACPIRFEFTWGWECSNPCQCPTARVSANVFFRPEEKDVRSLINPEKHGFSEIRIPSPWCTSGGTGVSNSSSSSDPPPPPAPTSADLCKIGEHVTETPGEKCCGVKETAPEFFQQPYNTNCRYKNANCDPGSQCTQ